MNLIFSLLGFITDPDFTRNLIIQIVVGSLVCIVIGVAVYKLSKCLLPATLHYRYRLLLAIAVVVALLLLAGYSSELLGL